MTVALVSIRLNQDMRRNFSRSTRAWHRLSECCRSRDIDAAKMSELLLLTDLPHDLQRADECEHMDEADCSESITGNTVSISQADTVFEGRNCVYCI